MNITTTRRHSINCLLLFWPPVALAALLSAAGCATNVMPPDDTRAPNIKFDPVYAGHDFQPRPTPATITSDEEQSLVSKGYYKLGTLRVDVNRYAREQLRDIFVKAAAAHGGDLVRLTVEAEAFREEDRDVGETAEANFPTPTGQDFNRHADGVPNDLQARPVQWGGTQAVMPQTIYQKGAKRLRSEGTVWRHDPQGANLKSAGRDSPQTVTDSR